jgi:hypothetical protein
MQGERSFLIEQPVLLMSQPRTAVSSRLYASFDDLPAAWSEICGSDLGMDPRVLGVFQRTLAGQCRAWGVMVFDADGVAIGCAALCLFTAEMIESAHPVSRQLRDRVRRIWPGFARMRVLFCGLPVPSGGSHLRVREGAHLGTVIEEVERVMQRLARPHKARLLVFKEMGDNDTAVKKTLAYMGYIRGDIPPMHCMNAAFRNFAEYRDALNSHYRRKVRLSQKKLKAAGFDALSGRGAAFVAEQFTSETHRLYAATRERAAHKLELMPVEFFHELAIALGDEVSLTLIHREGRPCAVIFGVIRGNVHYNLFAGVDYDLNHKGDLYFNVFYEDFDLAFRSGATSMRLGQTSDTFKSRLGSTAERLEFYARGRSRWSHAALRALAPLAFPKVAPVESRNVFACHRAPSG